MQFSFVGTFFYCLGISPGDMHHNDSSVPSSSFHTVLWLSGQVELCAAGGCWSSVTVPLVCCVHGTWFGHKLQNQCDFCICRVIAIMFLS